jgi:hypothetical protein
MPAHKSRETPVDVITQQTDCPRRTNIRTDTEFRVRNIVPSTRPAPLTHDGCLRILTDPEHRGIPLGPRFFLECCLSITGIGSPVC